MPYSLLSPQQPSAVTQLLGLLAQNSPAGQPGAPMPEPAAPMSLLPDGGPQVGVTPSIDSGQRPSFNLPTPRPLPRTGLLSPDFPNHQNVIGKIHDFISDRLGINEPAGYRGLLSPEEIQSAKPGILAAGDGASWTRRLDHIVAMKEYATGQVEHKRIMEARSAMPALFSAKPNETDEERNDRLTAMYDYSIQHSDFEMAKHLEGFVRTVERPLAEHTYAPKPFTDSGGNVTWISPGEPIPEGSHPYNAPRRPAGAGRTTGVAPAPIRTVGTQLKEAREDLRRATSAKPPSLLSTDAEKANYDRIRAMIPQFQQRVDSLSGVRDNMAAQQQGHAPTPSPTPSTPKIADPGEHPRDTVESQDEYDHLRNHLKWSDEKIAREYHIARTIRRTR